jgi:DNA-binding beta-propeller fold protein YncE
MDRFDFLELDSDGPKAPRQPASAEPEPPPTGWKPIRLRAIEVIGEPGAEAGQFAGPTGLAVDRDGAVYIADSHNQRVQRVAMNGDLKRYGRPGEAPGELWGPQGIAIDPSGQFFFVADQGNNRLQCFAFNGQHRGVMQGFRAPSGLSFDAAGRLWVADSGNGRVMCFDIRSGQFLGGYDRSSGLVRPTWVICNAIGQVFVTDSGTQEIVCFTNGKRTHQRRLNEPAQIALDSQGRLYVAESGYNRLHVFDAQGNSLITFDTPSARIGAFRQPAGVAIGPNGEIYVSDTQNHRILRLAWD